VRGEFMVKSYILDALGYQYCSRHDTLIEQLKSKGINFKLDESINHSQLFELLIALSYYDVNTAIHSQEVAALCLHIGKQVIEEEYWDHIYYGGLVHDIGKMIFTKNLFMGNKYLNEKEIELIYQHPVVGHDLTKQFTSSPIILDMVLHHHENMDGTGYPHKIKGEAITLYSRIIRIADMLSALTSTRKYRVVERLNIPAALWIIQDEIRCFDPTLFQIIKETFIEKVQSIAFRK
jgi:HD-GYP domain-containing protein (c-di-GMP phosphodiesterase class II)